MEGKGRICTNFFLCLSILCCDTPQKLIDNLFPNNLKMTFSSPQNWVLGDQKMIVQTVVGLPTLSLLLSDIARHFFVLSLPEKHGSTSDHSKLSRDVSPPPPPPSQRKNWQSEAGESLWTSPATDDVMGHEGELGFLGERKSERNVIQ
jgi:hypothetical protein